MSDINVNDIQALARLARIILTLCEDAFVRLDTEDRIARDEQARGHSRRASSGNALDARNCASCGTPFVPKLPHATLCFPCWRRSKETPRAKPAGSPTPNESDDEIPY